MSLRFVPIVILVATAAVVPAIAQQKPAPAEPAPSTRRASLEAVPLKVTVVLSRYQGEKRISSMPYSMGVTAKEGPAAPRTTLRMGVDVPVLQTVFGGGGDKSTPSIPQSSYTYRNVGTNIDCTASLDAAMAGIFQLVLTVSDTSVGIGSGSKQPGTPGVMADIPTFRSFNSSFTALLRDGQTTQYTSATDPLSGEVMKIDVTLNVMK
jgi:hypothetical protein